MWWNAKVGDKVVCINDENWHEAVENRPVLNQVYTIREIVQEAQDFSMPFGNFAFRLKEVKNVGEPESAFYSWRFRPLEKPKRKTDISIFKKIAADVPPDAKPDDEGYYFIPDPSKELVRV